MSFHRRDFLKLGLSQMALAAIAGVARAEEPPPPERRTTPSVLQGPTDDTKTQFSVVHALSQKLSFQARDSMGVLTLPDRAEVATRHGQKTVVSRVFFANLLPTETYSLEITDLSSGHICDHRTFRMLQLGRPDLKFVIASCMDDTHHEPRIWQEMVARKPDAIFFIGDAVYADKEVEVMDEANPDTLWRRFSESRATLEIYHSPVLIPVFATWDDHDFGENDADSSYPYVKESQKNFLTFFPQDPAYSSVIERGPGVSSAVQINAHLFILLDDRSWRLEKGSQDRYAHWGQAQERWMMEKIAAHRHGPIWIMNGSQIFPSMIFKESVSGDHPVQFQGFLDEIRKTRRKVLFASGDVHFSEISRIEPEAVGYGTYEVTSSSIHSTNFPGMPDIIPNHRRIMSTGHRNYVWVDSKILGSSTRSVVRSLSIGKQENFSLTIEL